MMIVKYSTFPTAKFDASQIKVIIMGIVVFITIIRAKELKIKFSS